MYPDIGGLQFLEWQIPDRDGAAVLIKSFSIVEKADHP
jgi:hypothetical protein